MTISAVQTDRFALFCYSIVQEVCGCQYHCVDAVNMLPLLMNQQHNMFIHKEYAELQLIHWTI